MKNKQCSETLSWGEFFDRFTILMRKVEFDEDNYADKVKKYISVLDDVKFQGKLLSYICALQIKNVDIWNLESDIRKGKEGELGLIDVGKRALMIRNLNKDRIALVNKINEFFGETYKETKFNHASKN